MRIGYRDPSYSLLDELFSLDVGHTVHTSDTITIGSQLAHNAFDCCRFAQWRCCGSWSELSQLLTREAALLHIPDGENTAGLSEVGLLLYTTDTLLENRRDLGGRGLGFGVGTGLDGGCGISDLARKTS